MIGRKQVLTKIITNNLLLSEKFFTNKFIVGDSSYGARKKTENSHRKNRQ